MSRFLKIFIFAFFSFPFILPAENDTTTDTSPKHVRMLIKKLSAADFADREQATKDLISLGYYSRGEVKKALGSKDPEVRMRLKEIWEKIKWDLLPGVSEDDKQVLSNLANDSILSNDWDKLTKKYGPGIIILFSELNKNPEYKASTLNGLHSLLSTSSAEDLSDYIRKSPEKEKLTSLFLPFINNNLTLSLSQKEKLQDIFISLGYKKEAVMASFSKWWITNDRKIPESVLHFFKNADFSNKIFKELEDELNDSETSLYNDWKLCFFAKIAIEINRKELLKNLLNDLDYNIKNESAIVKLTEILISLEMYKEAIEILEGNHSLKALYLRVVAYNRSGNKEIAEKCMELLDTKLKKESDLFSVAEIMNSFNDSNAVKLWEKILKMGPEDSIYDCNTRFRLAYYYTTKGEYGKAADLLERGMNKLEGVLRMSEGGQSYTGKVAEKKMKLKIYKFREQEKGGGEIWFKALNLMYKKNYKDALDKFKEFMDKNPTYPYLYYNFASIYQKKGDIDKAIFNIDKGLELINESIVGVKYDFLIYKAFLLRQKARYKDASVELEKAVELDPENEYILSIYAMTTYYAKDFKKSAELFAKRFEMGPEDLYAPLWRYISLSKIGKDSKKEFANFADKLKGNKWPIPLIKFYNGDINLQKCIDLANDIDQNRENEKRCEAFYFIGELMLLDGRKKEAEKYFKKCIECNISDFREHTASLQRLEELKK